MKSNDKIHAFIVERPLQIVSVLSILEQLKIQEETEILIAHNFQSAREVFERISIEFTNIKFTFHSSYRAAIDSISAKNHAELFVHWDMGFHNHAILKNIKNKVPGITISVFEEGVGTYRQDVYSGLKKTVFNLLRRPVNIGGSRFTDKIYVYRREEYMLRSRKVPAEVIEIKRTIEETIDKHYRQLVSIFGANDIIDAMEERTKEECVIYLSNWDYSSNEENRYFTENSLNILKLHPYCKEEVISDNILIAPKPVPAELLLHCASRSFERVKVYHKGSSVELYITSSNVEFVDLRSV